VSDQPTEAMRAYEWRGVYTSCFICGGVESMGHKPGCPWLAAAQLAATHAELKAAQVETSVYADSCHEATAQLAAMHAAIRALPRYQLHVNVARLEPRLVPFDNDPNEMGAFIKAEDLELALNRLLGDPEGPRQTEIQDDQSRVDGDTRASRRQDLPRPAAGDKSSNPTTNNLA